MTKIVKLLNCFIVVLLIAYCLPAKLVSAQYGQYGEVEVRKSLSLNKTVLNPKTGQFVDNLFASDYRFSPQEEVTFKLSLTNTGNTELTNIKVKDILPASPAGGPNYLNLDSGLLETTIGNLPSGQTKDLDFIKARVLSYDNLPKEGGLFCVINIAEVKVENMFDRDTSQICIEKKLLGFVSLPEAGPAQTLAILLGSTILGFTGLALLKNR